MDFSIRTDLRPGDVGWIVHLHGTIYAQEQGWDSTFEAYVAGPLAEFVRFPSERQRLWIAERENKIVGCVAIVAASPEVAQLRWYLVTPDARGLGLGKTLLREALAFARAWDYREVMLWTERSLAAAAHLYRTAGFQVVEEKAGNLWGANVVEERYELII
jgi:GNAT superfamily N-acetyltransferase